MDWVMVGLMVASAATQATVSVLEGQEARRQAKFNEEESKKQANLEQERANIAQLQGEKEAEKRMRAYAQEVGSIYANSAGNGLLVDSKSEGDVLSKMVDTSTIFAGEDVSTIRDNTALTIWTHTENRKQLLRSAENYKKSGKAAYTGGLLGASAAAMQGAAGAGYMAYNMGMFSSQPKTIALNSVKNQGSWQGGQLSNPKIQFMA